MYGLGVTDRSGGGGARRPLGVTDLRSQGSWTWEEEAVRSMFDSPL